MAQLKDTLVSGSLRVTENIYSDTIEVQKLKIPTASNTTVCGVGTNGQIVTSNGTNTYWSNLPASYTPSAHSHAWSEITGTPASYTPSTHTHDYAATTHTHTWSQISNPPASYTPSAHTHTWANISNPPASYTPSSHSHAWSEITSPPATYTPSSHNHSWSEITNTPASYTPSTHTHSEYALINSPQFTGTPTAPDIDFEETPTYSQIATENWVNQKVITVITITEEEENGNTIYTYTPNLTFAELTELALNNRLQLIYEDSIYPFVRYYTWRPGMFGSLHHVFEFSRIQYADMNDIATDIGVYRINFEYDTTTSLFLEPELTELGFLTTHWHDQYTVQDTTLIIGDVPVDEINVLPTPDPGGGR